MTHSAEKKTIKFESSLVPLVLQGSKKVTWRMFDDKDISAGDAVVLLNKMTGAPIAEALITEVSEKPLGEMGEEDFAEGHERYEDRERMLATFRRYYGDQVGWDTPVKIIRFELKSRSAFTLIELLVVIAIVAILAVVVVLVLNPAQLLAQSRDANRVQDMATLNSAVSLYQTDGGSLGTSTSSYLSLPDASSTCIDQGFPSGFSCVSSTASRNIDGTGWIPLDFKTISSGSPLGSLPLDPVNSSSSGLYYTYLTDGTHYELIAGAESEKYRNTVASLGGGIDALGSMPQGTLVGWWPMNEGSGNIAYDRSGNGDNGTWNGSSTNGSYYTAGSGGGYAGYFDGSTDYIATNYVQNAAVEYSISAWVNTVSTSGLPIVQDRGTGAGMSITFEIGYNGGQSGHAGSVNCGADSNGIWIGGYTTATVNDGKWHNVICTFNGSPSGASVTPSDFTVYIDGVAAPLNAGTGGSTVSPLTGLGGTIIGYQSAWTNYFGGKMQDVRIYNSALLPAEAETIYNAGT